MCVGSVGDYVLFPFHILFRNSRSLSVTYVLNINGYDDGYNGDDYNNDGATMITKQSSTRASTMMIVMKVVMMMRGNCEDAL